MKVDCSDQIIDNKIVTQALSVESTSLICALGLILMMRRRQFSKTSLIVLTICGYVYMDYYFFIGHCFLDRLENQESRIGFIRDLANEFKIHHDTPRNILNENHVAYTNLLVFFTILLVFVYLSLNDNLLSFAFLSFIVSIVGVIGSANHYYCHRITHEQNLTQLQKNSSWQFLLFKSLQRFNITPTSAHHSLHHRKTDDVLTIDHQLNWNLLNGFNKVYEHMYKLSGQSYELLSILFYFTNPVSINSYIIMYQIFYYHI